MYYSKFLFLSSPSLLDSYNAVFHYNNRLCDLLAGCTACMGDASHRRVGGSAMGNTLGYGEGAICARNDGCGGESFCDSDRLTFKLLI